MTSTRRTTATTRSAPRRRNRRGSGEQLRADIITATKALLASSGNADAVSIRGVAEAVGVTSPSIYLHFADKDALVEAVVIDVFAELDAAMVAAAVGIDEPLERLCAYGLAYVDFAITHPEHYRLATMDRPTSEDDPGAFDMVLADSAFTHMMETVSGCMAQGTFAAADPLQVTLEMWSAAHGVAALMISKPYLPWGDKREFANRVLRSIALGHGLNDLLGGDITPAQSVEWFARNQRAT